jgi:hypothetical protein
MVYVLGTHTRLVLSQLELLRDTYRLDDNSNRILMGLRLREKAAKWFHLKPDHSRIMVADLFDELQRVFL